MCGFNIQFFHNFFLTGNQPKLNLNGLQYWMPSRVSVETAGETVSIWVLSPDTPCAQIIQLPD